MTAFFFFGTVSVFGITILRVTRGTSPAEIDREQVRVGGLARTKRERRLQLAALEDDRPHSGVLGRALLVEIEDEVAEIAVLRRDPRHGDARPGAFTRTFVARCGFVPSPRGVTVTIAGGE